MKKLKIYISLFFLLVFVSININQLCSNTMSPLAFFSSVEALTGDETIVAKYAYRSITANCKNYDFKNTLTRCCKGSTTNCRHESCNGPVLGDCEARGFIAMYK